jgi:prepilin-type processing-associated H-X9-DG protein/prepilin-type N-terminal cleavage/methylation domain-containing protein
MTLIEVLIAITIIGVLGGLLIPCINIAYRLSLRTACSSNLRQVGMITLVYAGDHDDFLPAARQLASENAEQTPAWFRRLPEYLGKSSLKVGKYFQCAGYKSTAPSVFTNATPKSFKMNGLLERRDRGRCYKLGSVRDESTLVLFVDGVAKETGMGQWGHAVQTSVDGSRHHGTANILYCDGHTQSVARAPAGARWDQLKWESDDWK